MTIGTAIVICVGMLCGTFLLTLGLGVILNKKKNKAADVITNAFADEINKRLHGNK